MSAYRLPEMKQAPRQQQGDSVELARQWGEMNYGAPAKKKTKSSLEDGSDMDYNFLAASSLAAWMNVAALMNDGEGEDDEDGRPRLRIAGHLVSDETDNKPPAQSTKPEPNAALLNVTKALSSATDGADSALTKAWLAAAATNSGDSLSEEQIQWLLAKRNQPMEEEPPPPRAVAQSQALAGTSVASASSSTAVTQEPAVDPAEKKERTITESLAESERQQKEASQRSSRVAASIAAFAASAAATAAAATNAEKKRAAEKRKLQQAADEKAKKDAPPPPVVEKVKVPSQEESDKLLHSFAFSSKGPKKSQHGMPDDPNQKLLADHEGLVYVGSLPRGTGAAAIEEELEKFGRLMSVDVSASSRWALVKFEVLNDAFKAVGRLSRKKDLFGGGKMEVRLGTAKDLARLRGELPDDDEVYDPEAPTEDSRRDRHDRGRGRYDERDHRDDNRRRDYDEEYGRNKNRTQRRDDSRDRRQDISKSRDRAAPYETSRRGDPAMDAKQKTTETFRELFNAERSRVQKKLAKGAQNVSSVKKHDDDYEYYSYSDDDAPRNPRGKGAKHDQRKGKGKGGAAEPPARSRTPAHIKLLGPEPEYSYYSDSEVDDDGNVIRYMAPALKSAMRSAGADDPSGGRQVRVRGCWSEYLLPDNRTYWVNIQTGEKSWARPPGFDNSARSGAAYARDERDQNEAATNPGKHSNVFVGSLPSGITEANFPAIFERFGKVLQTKLIKEKNYGFAKFAVVSEAARCVEVLNAEGVLGLKVSCKFANMDSGVY